MKELKEPCKSEIASERCLGCNLLELEDFESNPKCEKINQGGFYNE